MADFLKIIEGRELADISVRYNYLAATEDFVGLKLLPMVRTNNIKVAIYNLLKGHDIPVTALVHSLDAEARIADRPNYEYYEERLLLVKAKLAQSEELRKKIKDLGMDSSERSIIESIYDDISNLIMEVLTAFERRACEVLCTGKIVVKENNIEIEKDYHLSADNKVDVTEWNKPEHDIFADINALKIKSKNKIVRMIVSSKVFGYILANDKLNDIAAKNAQLVTVDYAKSYILSIFGIDVIIDDRTFKLSHIGNDNKEYRFFDEDTIVWLTTRGEVGKTYMENTPYMDAHGSGYDYGFLSVAQWVSTGDPWTSYTEVEGYGLPVIADINNTLYISKVSAGE